MDEIPLQLVINFDQTGINYIPTSSWTMEKQGSKRVEIIGKDDKHQITAVLAGTMAGDFLPIQLVYQGTTRRCLPSFKFPQDWDVTYSPNHWSNEVTMASYLQKIIFPYIRKKQNELNLPAEYPALLLFDNFNGQCTETLLKMIDDNNINTVIIPANCTNRLQPLDLSVNKAVKNFLRKKFQDWYAKEVFTQLEEERVEMVDLCLSTVKPLGAQWMVDVFNHFKTTAGIDIIKNKYKAAGILK